MPRPTSAASVPGADEGEVTAEEPRAAGAPPPTAPHLAPGWRGCMEEVDEEFLIRLCALCIVSPWFPWHLPQWHWPTQLPLLMSSGFISILLSKAGYKGLRLYSFPCLTWGLNVTCCLFGLFCSEIKVCNIKKMQFKKTVPGALAHASSRGQRWWVIERALFFPPLLFLYNTT